ncbi:MAG: glycosyltransferase [Paracoccaceae bacterium]
MTKIAIGCITRARPKMFAQLLDSLAEMDLPDSAEVIFCFAENNDTLTMGSIVADFRAKVPGSKVYLELEERLGIPLARNNVLTQALAKDCDYLAFMDDDEVVDKGWLVALFATLVERELDLVGGPVRTVYTKEKLPLLQRQIFKGLVVRARRVEWNAGLHRKNGTDRRVTIVTNNWLVRLGFLKTNNIRFDDELGLSGGSDVAIYREIQAAGGKTGWAPEAIVIEEMPESRISLKYQYTRGRDQQLATYNIKKEQSGKRRVISSIVFIVMKSLLGGMRIIVSPLFGGTPLVLGLRALGAAAGRLAGLLGKKSVHYTKVAGH